MLQKRFWGALCRLFVSCCVKSAVHLQLSLLSVTFYFWFGAGNPGGVSCYAPIPDKGCNVSKSIMRHALKDFASDCNHSLLLVGYRNWNGWASLHAPLCMRTHLNRHTKHCGTWALDVSVRGCVATTAQRNALLDPLCRVSQKDLAQWQTLPKKQLQTSTVMACNMLRDFLEEVHHS